ncbi:MAG: hypothetical protein R3E39_10215 [Anaerolineae bacterium]
MLRLHTGFQDWIPVFSVVAFIAGILLFLSEPNFEYRGTALTGLIAVGTLVVTRLSEGRSTVINSILRREVRLYTHPAAFAQ